MMFSGENIVAVTGPLIHVSRKGIRRSRRICGEASDPHRVIVSEELEIEAFQKIFEPVATFASMSFFSKIVGLANERNLSMLPTAPILDDLDDYSRGAKAPARLELSAL